MRAAVQMRFQKKDSGMRGLWLATIAVVVLLLADTVSGGMLRAGVRAGAAYLWRISASLETSIAQSGIFSSRRQLAAANAALQEQLDSYRAQEAAQAALVSQNQELQALVHLAQKSPGVTVPVVSSTAPSPYGTFLIGGGSADGIAVGDLVFTADGFAVGRISDMQKSSAVVSEFFAPAATLEAMLANATITLEGQGGENARAQISRALQIRVGDVIVSAAAGGSPVAVVGKVEADPASAFQEIYARVPSNISTVRYVYVRKP